MTRDIARLTGLALDGAVLRQVALGIADGQLEQADLWLLVAAGHEPRPNRGTDDPLVRALKHLRSAAGWLKTGAEHG